MKFDFVGIADDSAVSCALAPRCTAARFLTHIFHIVFWLSLSLPTCVYAFGESFDINEPADEYVATQVWPKLQFTGVPKESLRIKYFQDHLIIRLQAKKTCAGEYCLTYILAKNSTEFLTSALLPNKFAYLSHAPVFLEGTTTIIFGDRPKMYAVLGSNFATVLALAE